MNFQLIKRTLGWILLFETIFFLVPLITAICYLEQEAFVFLICMAISGGVGGLCFIGKPKKNTLYAKEGFVIVALGWIIISLFGCLPFLISGAIPSFIDALFETVSGFTTTGASILTGDQIESMARSLLTWRSFTHWVGGMGVLVFILAFLPLTGMGSMHLMKAESPGPEVGKLVPKISTTAKILYVIYFAFTLFEFIFLLFGGMSVFEAMNTAFATAGTGGFGVKADGMGGYNNYLQIVVTVFMLLFSINFNSYYLLTKGKWKEALTSEVKVFLIIVTGAIAVITLNLCITGVGDYSIGEAIKYSAFSVASVVSTTGFTTADFNLWPVLSKSLLVLLMFIGACAGSTGGGIKVSRIMIFSKNGMHEIGRMIHPKQVKKLTIDKKVVDDEVIRSVTSYFICYIIIFVLSMLLISLDCNTVETAFTAVVSTLNNIGPGLGAVGPTGNFAFFSGFSKIVFIFDMLLGRLEIFPLLVLFAPALWKK